MYYNKINKCQALVKRIYTLAVCLFGFSLSAVGQINPTFSATDFRGDFIMIGNVNHELDSANLSRDTIEIKSPLRPIKKVQGYDNSNTATFNLGITEPCDDDGVIFANLSWVGKIPTTENTDYKEIKFSIDGGTNFQSIITEKTEIISNSFNNDYNGIYVCHKNVTDLFQNINLNSDYIVAVADITTKLDEDLTKFSGWTLTIVYKQKTKDPINISYYRPDIIVESGGNGRPATDINQSFNLGYKFNGVGDITVGTSFACGTNMEDNENLFIGNTKTITQLSTISKTARSKKPQLIISGGRPDGNFLCNKINGRSNPGNANSNSSGYSRGFDLEVITLDNRDSVYLSRNDSEISVLLDGCSEHHLFADFLVATGFPKVPEMETVLEAEAKDSSVRIVANINTRTNIEDLNNFNLNIKLPDYTKKISDFKISGKLIDTYKQNGKLNYITIKESEKNVGRYAITSIKRTNFTDIFAKLEMVASTRQTLNISYDGIIPSDLSEDKILTIEFIAHVDPEMYARKGALLGSESNESVQAELGVTGNDSKIPNYIYSNPYSVLSDSLTDPCYDFADFGGGNGFGGFDGGGNSGGSGGSGGRNGQPTEISFDFEFGCSNLPDTITIDGCENECFPVKKIKEILIREYQFDIDSLAKIDSLAWIEIKRDSLIELFTLSIEDKIRLDSDRLLMYSDSSNWYSMKVFWTNLKNLSEYKNDDTLKNYLKNHCLVTERELTNLYKKADDIINRKVEVTHLDYSLVIDKWEIDNGNGGKDTCIPFIEDEAMYSVIFATPYKNRSSESLCNDTLIIKANKEDVPLIELLDGNTSINNNGTIQYCKEENLGLLTIKRGKRNYEVEVIDDKFSTFTLVSDSTYIFKPNINTKTPGKDSVKFIQKNNTGCISDTFTLHIEVLDVTASETPALPSAINRCVTPNETVVITIEDLESVKAKRAEGFDVRWFAVINNRDSIIAEDTISIEVPIDSVGNFTYGAKFYFFGCESKMAKCTLNVNAPDDKIPPATISGCQYSTPNINEIKNKIISKTITSNVYYFPYDSHNPTPSFTENESESLENIVNNINFNIHGDNYFYVCTKNQFECWNEPSIIKLQIHPTDTTRPEFIVNEKVADSVLYCVGDNVNELDNFINKSKHPGITDYRWYSSAPKKPYNTTPQNRHAEGLDININSTRPSTHEYYAVRIDNNGCASNYGKFKVVVGDRITTPPPAVGGIKHAGLNVISVDFFCKNVSIYENNIIPIETDLPSYSIDWAEKSSLSDECPDEKNTKNVEIKNTKNRNGDFKVNIGEVGSKYYCVRQSTLLGCKGPWITVKVTVNDSVKDIPTIKTPIACQYDNEIRVKDSVIYPSNLALNIYNENFELVNEKDAIIKTDVADKFLSSLGNNKYFASLKNEITGCEGKIVGVDAIIHPKPSLPLVDEGNKQLYFCVNNQKIHINDFAQVTINPYDHHTKLSWDKDSIITTQIKDKCVVWQVDTITLCKSDTIEINYIVDKTFEYSPTDSIIVCHNESVNLWNIIEKNIRTKNQLIKNAKTEFSISPIIGNIQQAKLSQIEAENIVSTAISSEDQIKDYIIKIWEPISGCEVYDSMCIRFKALPKLEESTPGSFCQYELFDLPTPSSDYNFEWKIVDGESVNVWNDISLTQDETFRLTATTKDSYQCKDSIDWNVKIIEIPDTPTALDTTYCQFTGKHAIETQLQGTTNNPVSDLSYIWYKNGVVTDKVNTDTLFSGKSIQETYTVVVTNQFTRCSNRDSVIVNIWQAITLNMEDIEPVCEPETINVANKVNIYTSTNIASFGGNTPKLLSYFILENGQEKEVTPNDLSAIDFDSNHFERYFGYKMTDSRGVCTSADTFKVTIHPKPSVPTIEGGQDTLFFCKDDAPLTLSAMPNGRLTDIGLFWDNGAKGNTTPVKEDIRCATYNVQAIDTVTLCKGDFIGIVAAIAPAIQTKPIFKNDTIELCAGEILNLWDLAYNSFNHDGFYNSELIITQSTKNGNAIGQNLLEQITSTQQDTSTYWFEITDPLTSCSATNTVVVVFHAKPTIVFDGETTICQNTDLKLNTTGDERLINYKWEIDNILVSTSDMYQQTNLQDGFEIKLTTTLDELKSCSSTINQKIIVNPAPETLTPITFNRCQTESEKIVKINRNRSSNEIAQYAITWFNTDGTIHLQEEEIEVDLAQSHILEYDVMLTNRTTSCIGAKSRVTIKINPRIQFNWTDPDTICPPDEYQLLQNVLVKVVGGTNPKYQYTLLDGDTVRNENNIAQSGRYTVYFTDDNQCENSQEVNVQFFKRPEVPTLIAQNIVCQGIGDITFSAKKNGEDVLNQTFEWKEGVKTTLSDQLNVSTDEYGIRNFIITAVDTLSHCRSEESTFKLDIREKIHFSPIEPLESCFDVPVDLTLATQNAYSGNDEEKILSYFSVNSNNSLSLINDPTNVLNSGKVVIKAEESESGCNREDTIIVDIKLPLQISTIGTTTICEGEEINDLTAINAERYNWVRQNGTEVESTLFPFGNSLTETETFRLYGEKKVGNIYCMDSTDVEITVNPNPLPLKDSVLYFCQTTNGVEELQFSTNERNGELLEITWLNSDGDILFGVNQEQIITTTSDTTYTIYAKQINKETSCESKLTKVEVNILPKIEVPTIDSTTCQPNFINLSTLVSRGVTAKEYSSKINIESIGITNEIDRSLVTPISNSTEITESGIYRVSYSYTHENVTCRNSADAKLTFLQQPQKPSIANQSFCQNTGEVELAGTPSYTNLRLIWEDLSVYPSRIDTNTTTVSTELATEKSIKVRHIQDNSGCISADTIIRVKILPELIAMDLDTSICYGESVNLREMVENNHRNNPLINNIQFKNLDAMQFDEKKVENTSLYQAYFSDASGVCRDTSLVQINVSNPVEITLEGANPSICAHEVIQITASGADNYKWNEFNEGATFTLKTTTPQKMQINLRAKQAFKEIFCYKDSTISIEVMPAVEPLILTYDTCSKSKITTDLIKSKFNISENIDSIWYYDAAIRRDNISKVLEDEGNYQLLATNQYGCKAIHNMKVNMYNVGKLAIENDNSKIYCFNDTITFKATSENESKFTWKNSDNDSILYQGNNYWDSLKANTNLTLIASEVVMGCKDSISFTVNVREQTPIIVSVTSKKGETNVCKGDTIKLAVEGLNSVSWLYNDSIIESNNLEIIGEKTTNIYAWGKDIYNCQTNTEKVEINVATLSKPIIKTTDYPDEYDLSKEKTNIALYADGNTNNGQITYQWQIGNEIMHSSTMNSFSHTFSDETIHLNKDIEVNLYLEHEYGCKASASRILTIDPYLYVPNTLLYGHGIIFMEDYDLQIYDRVGTLIHEGKGWDGTYKGRPAIADTYFYSLMYYIKGEKQFKTGYITLVR